MYVYSSNADREPFNAPDCNLHLLVFSIHEPSPFNKVRCCDEPPDTGICDPAARPSKSTSTTLMTLSLTSTRRDSVFIDTCAVNQIAVAMLFCFSISVWSRCCTSLLPLKMVKTWYEICLIDCWISVRLLLLLRKGCGWTKQHHSDE